MFTRRMFLASAGASALMLHPALAGTTVSIPQEPVRNANLDILVDVAKKFLSRIKAEGGSDAHRGFLGELYKDWSDVTDFDAKVTEALREIYADPQFVEIKTEDGSIIDKDGRMNVFAQNVFARRFPIVPDYAGTLEVFRAFASFAPAHLL